MNNQRIVAQMANVDLIVEILANFLICNLFRRLVVVSDKIKNGIQVILLRGLRQAVVLHVGHEAFTQRSTAAFQNFGSCTFLRSFRKVISLPLVWGRRNDCRIGGTLSSFLRNVSTLFGFLTIVRYGMGAFFTHVCRLSRSLIHSGWVDIDRFLALAGNRNQTPYYITNPEDVKARARRFSSISTVARNSWGVWTLRQAPGFRAKSLTTFEPETVLAA